MEISTLRTSKGLVNSFLKSGALEDVAVNELPKGLYVVSVTEAGGRHWQQKLMVQ